MNNWQGVICSRACLLAMTLKKKKVAEGSQAIFSIIIALRAKRFLCKLRAPVRHRHWTRIALRAPSHTFLCNTTNRTFYLFFFPLNTAAHNKLVLFSLTLHRQKTSQWCHEGCQSRGINNLQHKLKHEVSPSTTFHRLIKESQSKGGLARVIKTFCWVFPSLRTFVVQKKRNVKTKQNKHHEVLFLNLRHS